MHQVARRVDGVVMVMRGYCATLPVLRHLTCKLQLIERSVTPKEVGLRLNLH
jgi:hypothetical protein